MGNEIKVEFDVPATMRDGTILRANIYRPAETGSYPIALTRTPYGKDFFSATSAILDPLRMARAGYIVIVQDVRGRFRSEGEWEAFRYEGKDGYDTVEWAATLPDSNGNVGMFGASYFGFTQWVTAGETPPHLKAIMPAITWADARDGIQWRGGAMELGTSVSWQLGTMALDVLLKRYKDASPEVRVKALLSLINEINRLRTEGYYSLPLKEFEPLKKLEIDAVFVETLKNSNSREFAAFVSPVEFHHKVTVPAYNIGGWYDIFLQGTFQNFNALVEEGSTAEAKQSKVLIGPWSHVNYSNVIGEMDFGFTSQMAFMNMQTDLTGLTQRWFDYWLKGIENGVTSEPPVKLFIMGANVWRDEQEWPLARTTYTPYYLHPNGGLATEKPGNAEPDHYTYDPENPTPTYGGAVLMNPLFGPGVKDQRNIEARPDVLVFTSQPLEQDTEITGPIVVKLWASSDAPDTDFVARLVDVHPDGFAQNLTDGIIRARYRNGETAELLEPGKAYEFTINLWATANLFKTGHAIRLQVTSSNFPRWDRNPNTGAALGEDSELRVAHQTILHDSTHLSQVILPVIPRG